MSMIIFYVKYVCVNKCDAYQPVSSVYRHDGLDLSPCCYVTCFSLLFGVFPAIVFQCNKDSPFQLEFFTLLISMEFRFWYIYCLCPLSSFFPSYSSLISKFVFVSLYFPSVSLCRFQYVVFICLKKTHLFMFVYNFTIIK